MRMPLPLADISSKPLKRDHSRAVSDFFSPSGGSDEASTIQFRLRKNHERQGNPHSRRRVHIRGSLAHDPSHRGGRGPNVLDVIRARELVRRIFPVSTRARLLTCPKSLTLAEHNQWPARWLTALSECSLTRIYWTSVTANGFPRSRTFSKRTMGEGRQTEASIQHKGSCNVRWCERSKYPRRQARINGQHHHDCRMSDVCIWRNCW